jgi:hypothetical protein
MRLGFRSPRAGQDLPHRTSGTVGKCAPRLSSPFQWWGHDRAGFRMVSCDDRRRDGRAGEHRDASTTTTTPRRHGRVHRTISHASHPQHSQLRPARVVGARSACAQVQCHSITQPRSLPPCAIHHEFWGTGRVVVVHFSARQLMGKGSGRWKPIDEHDYVRGMVAREVGAEGGLVM